MGDGGAIETKSASDDGGGHVGVRGVAGVHHFSVRGENQPAEKRFVQFAGSRVAEPFGDGSDGGFGGDLAAVVSADAVGEGEEPAVGADALGRIGLYTAEIILISGANAAEIRNLCEFNVHIWRKGGDTPRGCGGCL